MYNIFYIIHNVSKYIELTTLTYCGDEYLRLESETEDEFVERVLTIVKQNPKPNGGYLMGNIC